MVVVQVKQRRLEEVIATFRREIDLKNRATEPGRQHLVLIEGRSKRWTPENPTLTGRSDTNKVGQLEQGGRGEGNGC
jgi:hypothetical protein